MTEMHACDCMSQRRLTQREGALQCSDYFPVQMTHPEKDLRNRKRAENARQRPAGSSSSDHVTRQAQTAAPAKYSEHTKKEHHSNTYAHLNLVQPHRQITCIDFPSWSRFPSRGAATSLQDKVMWSQASSTIVEMQVASKAIPSPSLRLDPLLHLQQDANACCYREGRHLGDLWGGNSVKQ